MGFGLQWIVDKITFPSPPSSYSLTSHPELFFVRSPRSRPSYPGVPCMLYAIPQGAPVLLVHAHSNGCDIGDMRQTLQNISESLRVHVMSFEFPGYGLHLGSASMRSIDEAAIAVADFLQHDLKLNLAQVVWYGRSIGSGPALRMVHRISKELQQRPGGVVLQCGYANFPEVAGHLFGRVAKRLVSPLWTNEAMVKELDCPVLLIHGRNDTMIPIEQSEKLWEGVRAKELSRFHACDCGHNDFNFRRCTLRPIYDFLLGVISAPDFPASNFTVAVPPALNTYVHHIGPLRSRIPVYSFRRPELEEWLRFQRSPQAAAAAADTAGDDAGPVNTEATISANDAGGIKVSGRDIQKATSDNSMASASQTGKKDAAAAKKKAGKAKADDPPIPDYSVLPPIEDVGAALLEPEGLVRTCAIRVAAFLDRVQRQLDRVEDLEKKPMEEIVDLVEAEFWASDPLLCMWEEVDVARGNRVRVRIGPFSVDNEGNSAYQPGLGTGSDSEPAGLLRLPVWQFGLSPAHFRCLAEWSLLNCERLERNLPGERPSRGSSCCCVLSVKGRRRSASNKRARSRGGRRGAESAHPSRGMLATSLAAHFAHWVVERTSDVKAMFARFASLYKDPESALRRNPNSINELFPGYGKDMADLSPNTLSSRDGDSASEARPPSNGDTSFFPSSASAFSNAVRSLLREGGGASSGSMAELQRVAWDSNLTDAQGSPIDFKQTTKMVVCSPQAALTDAMLMKYMDWGVGRFLLHYERLLWGASEFGSDPRHPNEEAWGDPLRPELRATAMALNKAMKAFLQAEQRDRRESQSHANRMMHTTPQQPAMPTGSPGDNPPDGVHLGEAEPPGVTGQGV